MSKKHVDLMFVDSDPRECDRCDEKKICASIMIYDRICLIICKDCLMGLAEEFGDNNG